MRLRGYSVMTNVLEDHAADMELITLVRSSLSFGAEPFELLL